MVSSVQKSADELIVTKIYLIRNVKVMLDFDLAQLYSVETKQLKRQVRRNSQPNCHLKLDIHLIFKALKQLINPPAEPGKRIGFKP